MRHDYTIVKKVCADLNLTEGQWALSGSGVMVLHKLRDHKPMGDIDIFVATRLWFELQAQTTGEYVGHPLNQVLAWNVWTTDPDDPARRCDPPFLYREMHGIEVNVFFQWRRRGVGDIDVNFWMNNVEMVDNIPCIPLRMLYDWKVEVGRSKDIDDIQVLRRHFGESTVDV